MVFNQSTEIHQSNYFTSARYDYTTNEKRIMYCIVREAYNYIYYRQKVMEQNYMSFSKFGHVTFVMRISDFFSREQIENSSGRCYRRVMEAFEGLSSKRISFCDKDKETFSFGHIVNSADVIKSGYIEFCVNKHVWDSALDFAKGFTKLDFKLAMSFSSIYTMRFYEFLKRFQTTKIWKISVDEFRRIFCLENKYPRIQSLRARVIDVAKNELDSCSPLSFELDVLKNGKQITHFIFYIIDLPGNVSVDEQQKELLSKYPSAALSDDFRLWLKHTMLLTSMQINCNVKVLFEFERIFKDKTLDEASETYEYISRLGLRPSEHIGLFISNITQKVINASK